MEKDYTNYKPLKMFLEKQNIQYVESQELWDNIKCSVHTNGKLFLYNYTDAVLVPRNHPVLQLCRGIVIDIDGNVRCLPFKRFFNLHEKEAATIDWDTAIVQEKIDGSLINVFFYNDEWIISTKGSFYPNPLSSCDFAELFKKHFKSFDALNDEYCYMFELVTKENRIVTWYDIEFVVLLGARKLSTLNEVEPIGVGRTLDWLATMFDVRRPKEWFFIKSPEAIKKLLDTLKQDEEGFVVVDKNFNRVKVKSESYLKLSKIKQLSEQDILDHIRGYYGPNNPPIEIDPEWLMKDKTVYEKFEQIKQQWELYEWMYCTAFTLIKPLSEKSRKDFAVEATKKPYSRFLFALLDNRPTKHIKLDYDVMYNTIKD